MILRDEAANYLGGEFYLTIEEGSKTTEQEFIE